MPKISTTAWREALLALGVLLAGTLVLYRETAAAMVHIWIRSDTFTHAFLVPPIVGWLIWRRRHRLATEVPRPNPWMLLPLLLVAALWLIGDLALSNAITQFVLVTMLVLLVVAMLGWRATRPIRFPLAFLFFAVPIGEFMMPQLMAWTAEFAASALRLTGIPVFLEGQRLVVPSGAWGVVEACSGIRYLIGSVMVGSLFAYLCYHSLRKRLLFIGVSVIVPIVANWVRAYFIVLIGHLSNNQLAVGIDHLVYGWVFFGVVIGLMFVIGARWTDLHPAGAAVASRVGNGRPVQGGDAARTWATAAGLIVVMTAPHLLHAGVLRGSGEPVVLAPLSLDRPGWRLDHTTPDWKPAFEGADAELRQRYADDQGRWVGLYVGYYRQQDHQRKLVTSQNMLVGVDDPTWTQTAGDRRTLNVGDAKVPLRTARLRARTRFNVEGPEMLAWQVYWINGSLVENDALARFVGALHQLAGRGDDAAAIIVYAPRVHGGEALLERFLSENLQTLQAKLLRVRDGERSVALQKAAS
jgi:exosortase A